MDQHGAGFRRAGFGGNARFLITCPADHKPGAKTLNPRALHGGGRRGDKDFRGHPKALRGIGHRRAVIAAGCRNYARCRHRA